MPKPSRGGQRTRWQMQYQQAATQDEDEDEIVVTTQEDTEDTPRQQDIIEQEEQATAYDDIDWDNREFPELTQAEYDQIYRDNHDSYTKNGNITNAKKMYESAADKGNGFSRSQDMNYRQPRFAA